MRALIVMLAVLFAPTAHGAMIGSSGINLGIAKSFTATDPNGVSSLAGSLIVGGAVNAGGNVTTPGTVGGGTVTSTGNMNATGTLTAGGVTTAGTVAAGIVTATGSISAGGTVSAIDPVNPQDLVTKNYAGATFPTVTKVASNIVSPGTGWRAITGLTSPSYAANSVVSFSCTLLLTIASGNFALGVNGPASPAAVNTVMVFRDSASAAMDMNPAATTYDGGTLTGILTAAQVMHLYGTVTIGATPGALTARVNSSSGSFTIYAGSFCLWN